MNSTIATKNLVKRYRNRNVVDHVSIEVKQGEIVGLLGPNGAGKTTTFYQVVGLIQPDEGEVFLDDLNITRLPMYKRAQMGIGYLPQEASVFRKLSVEDNITAVLEMTDLTKEKRKEKLELLMDELRLHHVRKSNGDVVSGGERRRTEIARALAVDPKFILLDEPFAGIDPIAVEDIQTIVAKLKFKRIGILITDHNVTETLSICDRAYLLIEGKIFKHGTAEELAADEDVRRLYLGRNFELKRKDYLLEDVDSEKNYQQNDHNDAILTSINSAIRESERKLAIFKTIGVYKGGFNPPADLNFQEYCKYIMEVKTLLQNHAEVNNDEKLRELVLEMPEIHYNEFKRTFAVYDSIMNLFIFGLIALFFLSFLFMPKISKAERLTIEARSSLQKISVYLMTSKTTYAE